MPTDKDTQTGMLSRRALLVNGTAMAAVATLPNASKAAQKENAVTTATTTEQSTPAAVEKTAVRPFTVTAVSDADLTDLRKRINATRWPDREYVPDDTQGVQLESAQNALGKSQ